MAASKNGTSNVVMNEDKTLSQVVTDIDDISWIAKVDNIITLYKPINLNGFKLIGEARTRLVTKSNLHTQQDNISSELEMFGDFSINVQTAMGADSSAGAMNAMTFTSRGINGIYPTITLNAGRSDFPTVNYLQADTSNILYQIEGLNIIGGAESHHKWFSTHPDSFIRNIKIMKEGYSGHYTAFQLRDGISLSNAETNILALAGDSRGNNSSNVNNLISPVFYTSATENIQVYPNNKTLIDVYDMHVKGGGSWSGEVRNQQSSRWGTSIFNFLNTYSYKFSNGLTGIEGIKVGFIKTATTGTAIANEFILSDINGNVEANILDRRFNSDQNTAALIQSVRVIARGLRYTPSHELQANARPETTNETLQVIEDLNYDTSIDSSAITGIAVDSSSQLISITGNIPNLQTLYNYLKWWLYQDDNLEVIQFFSFDGYTLICDYKIRVLSGGVLNLTPGAEKLEFPSTVGYPNLESNGGILNIDGLDTVGGVDNYSTDEVIRFNRIGPDNQNLLFIQNSATFGWVGGKIYGDGRVRIDNADVNIKNAIYDGDASNRDQKRFSIAQDSTAVIDGFTLIKNYFNTAIGTAGSLEIKSITPVSTVGAAIFSEQRGLDNVLEVSNYESTSPDFDFGGWTDGTANLIDSNNGVEGSNVTTGTPYNNTAFGLAIYKDIQLHITDDNGNVEGAKAYVVSEARSTAHNARGVDWTTDRVYTSTTDVDGETAVLKVVLAENYGQVRTPLSYRGKTNDNSDLFDIHIWSYAHTYKASEQILKGAGVLRVNERIFTDSRLTETNSSVVAAYTGISIDHSSSTITVTADATLDMLFDFIKYNKLSNIPLPTVSTMCCSVSGSILTTTYDVVVDGAELSKGVNYTNLVAASTTINNNGVISVNYVKDDGTVNVTFTNLNPEGFDLETENPNASVIYKESGSSTWIRSGTFVNSITISLTPNTTYDIRIRVPGYDWVEGTYTVPAYGGTYVAPLQSQRELDGTNTITLTDFDIEHVNSMIYDPVARKESVSNTTGSIMYVNKTSAYKGFIKTLHNPAIVTLFERPVVLNADRTGFIIPDGNPFAVYLTEDSTNSVMLQFTVKYENGEDAVDRFHGNSAGFQVLPSMQVNNLSLPIPTSTDNATAVVAALDTTVTKVQAIPSNPLLATDTRLDNLDALISSRSSLALSDLNNISSSDLITAMQSVGLLEDDGDLKRFTTNALEQAPTGSGSGGGSSSLTQTEFNTLMSNTTQAIKDTYKAASVDINTSDIVDAILNAPYGTLSDGRTALNQGTLGEHWFLFYPPEIVRQMLETVVDGTTNPTRYQPTGGNYGEGTLGNALQKALGLPVSPAATGDAMTLTSVYDPAKAHVDISGLETGVAEIKERTDNLPDNPAALSDLPDKIMDAVIHLKQVHVHAMSENTPDGTLDAPYTSIDDAVAACVSNGYSTIVIHGAVDAQNDLNSSGISFKILGGDSPNLSISTGSLPQNTVCDLLSISGNLLAGGIHVTNSTVTEAYCSSGVFERCTFTGQYTALEDGTIQQTKGLYGITSHARGNHVIMRECNFIASTGEVPIDFGNATGDTYGHLMLYHPQGEIRLTGMISPLHTVTVYGNGNHKITLDNSCTHGKVRCFGQGLIAGNEHDTLYVEQLPYEERDIPGNPNGAGISVGGQVISLTLTNVRAAIAAVYSYIPVDSIFLTDAVAAGGLDIHAVLREDVVQLSEKPFNISFSLAIMGNSVSRVEQARNRLVSAINNKTISGLCFVDLEAGAIEDITASGSFVVTVEFLVLQVRYEEE